MTLECARKKLHPRYYVVLLYCVALCSLTLYCSALCSAASSRVVWFFFVLRFVLLYSVALRYVKLLCWVALGRVVFYLSYVASCCVALRCVLFKLCCAALQCVALSCLVFHASLH